MKTIKYAVAAVALSALSFGVFAAEPVSSAQAQSMNKIGVVSAEGATTLDGLEAKLAESRGCGCKWLHNHFRKQRQQAERYRGYL
jgi:ABC-type phosphate transport system substrate-binding protein